DVCSSDLCNDSIKDLRTGPTTRSKNPRIPHQLSIHHARMQSHDCPSHHSPKSSPHLWHSTCTGGHFCPHYRLKGCQATLTTTLCQHSLTAWIIEHYPSKPLQMSSASIMTRTYKTTAWVRTPHHRPS